jgi:hypothetical protein
MFAARKNGQIIAMILAPNALHIPYGKEAMSESSLRHTVHPHFLDKVTDFASRRSVRTTETIFDQDGTRLLHRGQRLTRAHRALLQGRTLRAPLECSLTVDDGPGAQQFVAIAQRLIDSCEPLACLLRTCHYSGATPTTLLSEVEFGPAIGLLLAVNEQELEHSVTVSLLAACMARQLRLTEDDQRHAALAGLLHDIGEVYLDPALQQAQQRWSAHQWGALTGHAPIGRLLVDQLESYPLAVGRAIAEHHERFDGSGYPSGRAGNHISAVGQALAVADMFAGVLDKDHALTRAEMALKIIPGEHARDLVAAISPSLHAHALMCIPEPAPRYDGRGAERLFFRMATALESAEQLLEGLTPQQAPTAKVVRTALERLRKLQLAFKSNGLDAYLPHATERAAKPAAGVEQIVAAQEIGWRLRAMARELAMHTSTPSQKSMLAPLIHLLDDESSQLQGAAGAMPVPDLAPAVMVRTTMAVAG